MTDRSRKYLDRELPRRSLLVAAAGGLGLAIPSGGSRAAENYPDRPINLVISFPPGGGPDLYGRIIAKGMEEALGQPVIPINKPGAGSLIATNYVKSARPDGYTLLFATPAFVINPIVRHVDYDPETDFTAIGTIARSSYVIVSNPRRGFTGMGDLIAYAKAHPNALRFGSPGIGVSGQLAGDLLRHLAQIKFLDVRYKGSSEAVLATMSGEVDFCFEAPFAVVPNVKTGRLTLLASAGDKRDPICPEAPIIADTLPGYSIWAWFGLVAPLGVSDQVRAVLQSVLTTLAADPVATKRLTEAGLDMFITPPVAFMEFMTQDKARWADIATKDAS